MKLPPEVGWVITKASESCLLVVKLSLGAPHGLLICVLTDLSLTPPFVNVAFLLVCVIADVVSPLASSFIGTKVTVCYSALKLGLVSRPRFRRCYIPNSLEFSQPAGGTQIYMYIFGLDPPSLG